MILILLGNLKVDFGSTIYSYDTVIMEKGAIVNNLVSLEGCSIRTVFARCAQLTESRAFDLEAVILL
jgi:hypothetical protein